MGHIQVVSRPPSQLSPPGHTSAMFFIAAFFTSQNYHLAKSYIGYKIQRLIFVSFVHSQRSRNLVPLICKKFAVIGDTERSIIGNGADGLMQYLPPPSRKFKPS